MRWVWGSLISVGLTLLAARLFLRGETSLPGLCMGWALAGGNAATAHLLNRRAMRAGVTAFALWGAVGNVVRAVVLVGLVLLIGLRGRTHLASFLVAVFAGYAVFLTMEIVRLHVQGLRQTKHE